MELSFIVDLKVVECAKCGVVFGITEKFMENRRYDHEGFSCPIGHINVYYQKNREEKALEALASERAAHDQTKADLEEKNRDIKKINIRIKNGVCPCCKRSFKNLHAHMKNKHNDF